MKKVITFLIGMLFCTLIFADGEKEKLAKASKAILSAEAWFSLLDQGKYDECFESASTYLKKATQKATLSQNFSGILKPLGKLLSRELFSITFYKELPGSPDGQYVTLQYAVHFENKNQGIETVTSMLEKDGSWKISGYFIK